MIYITLEKAKWIWAHYSTGAHKGLCSSGVKLEFNGPSQHKIWLHQRRKYAAAEHL